VAKKILLVEDEEELCIALGDRLQSQGYAVDVAGDGIEAIKKLTSSAFDLAIVDIMLPFRNGLEVCAEIRRSGISVPIIILTARSQVSEKIAGLKVGADDYVCKPFDALELMARIEAQLRRPPQSMENAGQIPAHIHRIGANVLDTIRTRVTRNGDKVNLTAKEFQLLRYLAEHRGKTITREDLLSQVWGQKVGTLTRTVDVHIASLRQKLEAIPRVPELILTIPGEGYQLALDAKDSPDKPYYA
jgi:two-component system, OmpR family, alkaline phosphatase synthesis response regulator PhoP